MVLLSCLVSEFRQFYSCVCHQHIRLSLNLISRNFNKASILVKLVPYSLKSGDRKFPDVITVFPFAVVKVIYLELYLLCLFCNMMYIGYLVYLFVSPDRLRSACRSELRLNILRIWILKEGLFIRNLYKLEWWYYFKLFWLHIHIKKTANINVKYILCQFC